jgi:cytidylate kinase
MYRAVTVDVLNRGIDPQNEDEVSAILENTNVELALQDGVQKTMLNGTDVTERIRDLDVTRSVSAVSAMKAVRDRMTAMQRALGKNGGVVMEGRDIGTVVFPDAEFKIYLDASIEVRAKRRFQELVAKGVEIKLEDLVEEIRERDRLNSERAIAPLKRAEDAVHIDTSGMTFDDQVEEIVKIVKTGLSPKKIPAKGIPVRGLYHFIQSMMLFYYRVCFRYEVYGIENVPMEGPVLIAPNHAAFHDPPLIASILKRELHFMAKKELYKIPVVGDVIKYSGSIPVDRGGYSKSTLENLVNELKGGWAVLIFPEGTRTKTGDFNPPKKGVGMVAVMADVPVVPCLIEGSFRAKPFRSVIKITFLPAFNPSEIKAETKKEQYLLVSEKIMCDIINLYKTHHGRA